MKIIFSKHAIEVLKIRKISKEIIKKVISNPHEVIEEREVKIAHYYLNDKMLRVIFKKMDKTYMVITAYIAHKERYRRLK